MTCYLPSWMQPYFMYCHGYTMLSWSMFDMSVISDVVSIQGLKYPQIYLKRNKAASYSILFHFTRYHAVLTQCNQASWSVLLLYPSQPPVISVSLSRQLFPFCRWNFPRHTERNHIKLQKSQLWLHIAQVLW
jgi:hypothetical protein